MTKQYSTRQLITVLGGISATAALTGRSYNQVSNWLSGDHFPPQLFLVMQNALMRRGIIDVPVSMWRMQEPVEVSEREVA